jgi:hypothetical protein
MKRTGLLVVTFVIAGALLTAPVWAQGFRWRGGGGWGPGTPYNRLFDPKTVQTVTGEVLSVTTLTPMRGMGAGVHITLKSKEGETIDVHLGPAWYLEHQDVKIDPKDTLEVTGSRVTISGKPALLAAEVKKGDQVLQLRDSAGVPFWAGWRHRAS